MEFTVNLPYFKKAISIVSNIVSAKTTLSLLTGVKLVASADKLTLIGSNADVIIQKDIPKYMDGKQVLEVYQPGSIILSAKYLSDLVSKLPGEIHIKVNEHDRVTIQSEEVITTFNGMNPDDYPTVPSVKEISRVQLASNELAEIIKQTGFAVSKNESRPVLTGVQFSLKDNELIAVATNSHRLALRKQKVRTGDNCTCIIPSNTLQELTKIIGTGSTPINVSISEKHIAFEAELTTLYSKLIEGNYPDISTLVPAESKTILTLDTKNLLNGIDRARLFASDRKNNNIHIESEDSSMMKISSNSTEIGNIEETQAIYSIEGEKQFKIALDGNLIVDALKVIKEELVMISINGSIRPVLMQPKGNNNYLHLISPVRSYETANT
ncbi:DNA polymerase III beta subunit family protein [Oceanobacillus limi]|uniref:Beta sliding clamp n=1 Tax=Oceanobacillus limi TaxID=930131 RepID=A0A1I0CFP8_9BACI|nr:DNA polymerase III subunit beta [Oceanobacillus limi]SET18389.1 DNA polymerase III beta subunit family protein [Oceanobacillus limi]